jgi:hypothetical protein
MSSAEYLKGGRSAAYSDQTHQPSFEAVGEEARRRKDLLPIAARSVEGFWSRP